MVRTEDILLFFITFCVSRISSQYYPITFEMKTVPQVTLKAEHRSPVSFALSEERRKLCMYAAMVAGLPHVDYKHTPQWERYVPWSSSEVFEYGMCCPTLPTVYVLQKAWTSSPPLQITFVSPKTLFEFEPGMIIADFINFRQDLKQEASKYRFAILDLEDRRNLCATGRQYAAFHFFDHNVDAAEPYEFRYSNGRQTEINFAIPCPTIPRLYLRENLLTNRVELVFPRTLIDYDFEIDSNGSALVSELPEKSYPLSQFIGHSLTLLNEEERMNLCIVARKMFGPFYVPSREVAYVPGARMYTFQYSEEQEKFDEVAISCPTSSMYLRSIDDMEGITRIKITFTRTVADFYTYNVQIVSNLILLSSNKAAEHKRSLEERWKRERESAEKVPDEYPKETVSPEEFARLNAEACWDLCSAAQKYVRRRPEYTFVFTVEQPILFEAKLLLQPDDVSSPRFYKIVARNANNNAVDIFIECSQWPRMYLSPSVKGIDINLFERELSKRNFENEYVQLSD